MELSAANRIKVGQLVSVDGVLFAVKQKPFGSAEYFNGVIVREEVTLTLTREKVIENGVEYINPRRSA